MRYTIRLCGGPAEGRIITITHLPLVWRVSIVRTPSALSLMGDNDLSRCAPAHEVDEIHYHDTGIRTADGVHLYVTGEILEQFREVIARLRPPDPSRIEPEDTATSEEGMLPRSCWEPAIVPGMSGKRAYPWDAIKREDTERLLNKIDEVTDDEN
jgi:hypothetical protein